MTDYASRADLDALRQQLQSAPGAAGFPFLRGVPQLLALDYSGALGPALTTDWETFYTYTAGGGMLYPNRVLEILMVGSRENVGANSGRNGEIRVTINDEALLSWEFQPAPGNPAVYTDWRVRVHGGGSNTSQLVTFANGGAGLTAIGPGLDLSGPWTIKLQVAWEFIDGDVYFARHHAMVTLT